MQVKLHSKTFRTEKNDEHFLYKKKILFATQKILQKNTSKIYLKSCFFFIQYLDIEILFYFIKKNIKQQGKRIYKEKFK